jgi:hypothetical protein
MNQFANKAKAKKGRRPEKKKTMSQKTIFFSSLIATGIKKGESRGVKLSR